MVSVGSLNLPETLLSSELRIMVLERLVEQLLEDQARMGHKPNVDMMAIRKDAIKRLRAKYPDMQIRVEGDE